MRGAGAAPPDARRAEGLEPHGQQCGSGPAFSRQPPPDSHILQHRRKRNVSRIGDWKQARPNGSHPPHPSASAYADTSLLPTGYAEAAAVIGQLPYVRRAASPRQSGVDRQRPFRPQQSEPVAERHRAPHSSRECGTGPVRPLEHRSAGPPITPATQRECPPALLGGPAPGRTRGRRTRGGGRRHATSPHTIGYRTCDAPRRSCTPITTPWPVSREECRVVRPRGELDLAGRDAFARLLRGTCRTTLDAWLIVDLTAVTFMDCTPLHELCTAQKRCTQAGHGLRLVYDQPAIGRLLAFNSLSGAFPRYASPEEAWSGQTTTKPS
ncbi:STAS domain-containing protein [Streptomyces tauricus]|uniref:STAS domain-containing protein n=1 Tax=Streptomyces tauricus TaxID=68274 RepID=UPI002243D1BC|nr:STAS domain-containing protein [Streptomyces tauricus]MCW8102713.1 STAS domain-containing protein [Streptomyces tauricus]